MKTHVCPSCESKKHFPELNDDPEMNPKIKLDELIQISGHGPVLFRVMKLEGMVLELEKIS